MDAFLELSAKLRAEQLERASESLGLSASAIEKDFWVCWVLRELFRSGDGPRLTFKGGTSLSKCWKLIRRFSEDIDLVVDREYLGFGGDAAPEAGTSRKKQEQRGEELLAACRKHVGEVMLPSLVASASARLGTSHRHGFRLDPDKKDQQCILFEYDPLFPTSGYLRPVVKIELGARSDTEPSEQPVIRPYLAEVRGLVLSDASFVVRAVAPERTFWEKVSLLHEESYREEGLGVRLARHYYDLWCLDQGGVAAKALGVPDLFRSVVENRRLLFRRLAKGQRTLAVGTVRLVPSEERMQAWRDDFEAMRDTMFFDDPPSFDQLMATARTLEQRINSLPAVGS